MNIEQKIIENLILDDLFLRKVQPFIKSEYFEDSLKGALFSHISEYFRKYNSNLTVEIIEIDLPGIIGLSEDNIKGIKSILSSVSKKEDNSQWLLDESEKFCQKRALYLAILKSVELINEPDKGGKEGVGSIPHIVSEALAVSFDNSIGHDYIEDAENRYEMYHRVEDRIPFDIEMLNVITHNGLPKKTLTILSAGTGVGKSLVMCHMASANLRLHKNVLYITMEMSEDRIAERIDANMMDRSIQEVKSMEYDNFNRRVNEIKTKAKGRLIIKEYPTSSAHAGHFRALLQDLKTKKKFVPDMIYIDYINICSSQRLKKLDGINSYTLIKTIAEELRGLAAEFNVPIVSATQLTRSGQNNSNPGLEDISESIGLSYTVDLMLVISTSPELRELNQIVFKQLKNRYADISEHSKFIVGIDKSRMKIYDLEHSAQSNIHDGTNFKPISLGKESGKTKGKFEGFIF